MFTVIVIAVAAAGACGLLARPAVAIPGGTIAATAWFIAAGLCWQESPMLPGARLASLLFAVLGCCCGHYAVSDARGVARRERERAEEWPDWDSQHAVAVDNILGGGR